ncbi:MAG: M23 family metallopeptidase [Candidatus Vogelbacteria bacterium]
MARPVSAGFLSFVGFNDVFGQTSSDFSPSFSTIGNSQTIPLLEPLLGPDPNARRGGGDTTIVDGNALLPDSGPLGTMSDIKDLPLADQVSVYVVRSGDTLSEVARMFQVSVNTIIWANDLPRATAIREGQVLVILPISGIQHAIVKGETLKSIAKKYRGDANEIAQYNGFDLDTPLVVGETLIVPDGEETPPPTTSGRRPRPPRGSGPSYAGYYIRPIKGGVRTQGIHGYNGVDLADSTGAPIYASAGGTVIVSKENGWNGGYAKYIVILHDNKTQTLYAHNNDNIVARGQKVVQGQVIGYVGSTGNSTGPHVHFEIRGAKNPF